MKDTDNPLRRQRHYTLNHLFKCADIKNGIMVFDDYGCMQFPGAKKAIDNYLKTIRKAFFVPLPSG